MPEKIKKVGSGATNAENQFASMPVRMPKTKTKDKLTVVLLTILTVFIAVYPIRFVYGQHINLDKQKVSDDIRHLMEKTNSVGRV